MKRIPKLLSVFMIGLFTVSCSSSKQLNSSNVSSGNAKVIKISVQAEKDWMDHYKKAAERVKEKFPNADIKLVELGAFSNLENIDSTGVSNPDVPDVYTIPSDRFNTMYKNDSLTPFDAKKIADEIGGWNEFDAGLASSFKVNDEYYAFPMNIETLITFANSKNAQNRGIDLQGNIEFTELNYDDMLVALWDLWYGVSFMNSVNFDLLSKDSQGNLKSDFMKNYTDLTPEQQDLFKTFFEYWKKHQENKTDLWDKTATWSYIDDRFVKNSSLRLDGPWSTKSLSELIGSTEILDVVPINKITVNGKELSHWKSGWGLAINPRIEENNEMMEVAIEMIKQIVNPDYAIDLFKSTGKILENVSEESYLSSDLSEIDKKVISAVLKSYENSILRPTFEEWSDVWTAWENGMISWASVKPASPQEAYETLQASFIAMLKSFK